MWAAFTAWRCGRSGVWTDLSLMKTCWNGKSHHGPPHRVDKDDMRIRSLQSTWDAGSSCCETQVPIQHLLQLPLPQPSPSHPGGAALLHQHSESEKFDLNDRELGLCFVHAEGRPFPQVWRWTKTPRSISHRRTFRGDDWGMRFSCHTALFFFTSVGYFVTFSRWKMVSGEIN